MTHSAGGERLCSAASGGGVESTDRGARFEPETILSGEG
jgi:hypothetical protein